MTAARIKISHRISRPSDQQITQMAAIVANYFPDQKQMEETIRMHLQHAGTVRLALANDAIVGFSMASSYKMKTPFYSRPVNVLYQRMLYLDPDVLYQGLGARLLLVTMKDLFGWLWPLKRMVVFCRTQNPVVAKYLSLFNVSYPQFGRPVPGSVRRFADSLLPVLGAKSLDASFRLAGSLDAFTGADYTDKWNRYYHRCDNNFEKLMLNSAFEERGGRIYNSGAFILMIGYARPFRFIRYLYK